jgi:hypothetical protein
MHASRWRLSSCDNFMSLSKDLNDAVGQPMVRGGSHYPHVADAAHQADGVLAGAICLHSMTFD